MTKQIDYTFSYPESSYFSLYIDETSSQVIINGNIYNAYPVTDISGVFNGSEITGLLSSSGHLDDDTNQDGSENAGPYDNTIFVSDSDGDGGSHFGIDSDGIGFVTKDGSHYAVYSQGDMLVYENAGTASQSCSLLSTDEQQVVCFTAGTRIRTTRGEIPVEALRVGDSAVTASGTYRTIRWIGHRTIDPRHYSEPATAHPVRIKAHAFGRNVPSRDLFLSPSHAICVDIIGEILIPVASLINGLTIAQVRACKVTYYHVELDSQDLLIAENLPAESYLEMGNRGFFIDTDTRRGPDPDDYGSLRTHAHFCRPFVTEGPLVEAVRARLYQRAIGETREPRRKAA